MIFLLFGFFQFCISEKGKRQGYIAPRIISAHSGYYEKLSADRPGKVIYFTRTITFGLNVRDFLYLGTKIFFFPQKD